ncbi:LbetaH domain-containing protein [Rubripirellula reticaptiva]|uniref:Galactoside O-acetyltransferase n=1 Tax=Rubripirellula reticaptiva TaxID=2528013 RepID=A0A5C6F2R3_9BACT|nr:putative colanic acid biosynthesis acetyltransferase [Rubripirellula reticaptiva]TWU55492.1 Galactoside O-acetyltransferase [Rubripirellula reticaptiva]
MSFENIGQKEIQRLDRFHSNLSIWNRLERSAWGITWLIFFRPSPRIAFRWRRFLLRCYGATIGENVRIYNSASIFLPRNLTLAAHCVIGPRVDVYCVASIDCGEHVMVSQNVELCAATHDYRQVDLPLVASPIRIEPESWVCASAFIGPGVTIGRGAVVGARSVVFKDVASEDIVAGNPAKRIRSRTEQKSAGGSGT